VIDIPNHASAQAPPTAADTPSPSAPTNGNAAQDITPDAAAMRQHVEHLFGGYLDGLHDGLIELAWTDTKPDRSGKYPLRHARQFGTDQIEELIAAAVRLNSQPMCNCYIGAALRKPGTSDKHASREDVLALTACHVDLDDPGAAASVKDKYTRAKPTLIVVTGRHPHLRAQPWWRLSESITDKAAWQALLKGMANALGGDSSVTDPPRVMRLAGSIAWPVKTGRVVELTEIVPLENPGLPAYTYEHLAAVFPPARTEGVTPPDGITYSKNVFGFDDKVVDGRERYMLRRRWLTASAASVSRLLIINAGITIMPDPGSRANASVARSASPKATTGVAVTLTRDDAAAASIVGR
jgi:hypothetical protein